MGGQTAFGSSPGESRYRRDGRANANNEPLFSDVLKDVALHPSDHSDEENGRHVGSHGEGCFTKKHQRVVCPIYMDPRRNPEFQKIHSITREESRSTQCDNEV